MMENIMVNSGLVVLLYMLMIKVSSKPSVKLEMASPFECGFNSKKSNRIPFSLHFFLIALIFLIFDVELMLILPFPLLWKWNMNPLDWYIILLLFFVMLILGLWYEWQQGALNWDT
uniref:NADH-ubiquinone oxidoreductase chain 3 n=1 Tax=Neomysis awatschensis TaxID=1049545 RepID=A0A6M3TVY0_9CRUS|nr:NADH dehydrognease subunit 3 [Neomysis awatschensis]